MTIEHKECKECTPKFDLGEVTRLKMTTAEIRSKYPRFEGTCGTCNYTGIKYASQAQYVFGDY